jgi:hypothetical protein
VEDRLPQKPIPALAAHSISVGAGFRKQKTTAAKKNTGISASHAGAAKADVVSLGPFRGRRSLFHGQGNKSSTHFVIPFD